MKGILKKLSILFCMCSIAVFAIFISNDVGNNSTDNNLPVRNIELIEQKEDYKEILNKFENVSLMQEENSISFEGEQKLNLTTYDAINNVNDQELELLDYQYVTYKFKYDYEENVVTISASLLLEDGSIYLDEVSGVAFYDQNGNVDAVMNVDDQPILLSEMKNTGLIENCGWLKKLIKLTVTAVVTVATVAVVAAVIVATAGAAAPALIAVGVGTVSASYAAAGIAACAGAIVSCTLGKAMIQAGTAVGEVIGDGLEQVVDKTTGLVRFIIITGVEFAVRVLSDAVRYELQNGKYYLALVGENDNVVYVSVNEIDSTLATWALRLGVSVYNYYSENAYQIAKDAYPSSMPIHDSAKVYQNVHGMYFNHWHLGNRSGGHSFYGIPLVY